jgi:hypothetical protein
MPIGADGMGRLAATQTSGTLAGANPILFCWCDGSAPAAAPYSPIYFPPAGAAGAGLPPAGAPAGAVVGWTQTKLNACGKKFHVGIDCP